MLSLVRQLNKRQLPRHKQIHFGFHEARVINGANLDMDNASSTRALAKELTSAVPAKLLRHRYAGIVRVLEGIWRSLKNFQVAFVDEHKGSEASTRRATAVIAVTIKSAYQITVDLISDRPTQATTTKFSHYRCPRRCSPLTKVYALVIGESIDAECRECV